MRFDGKYRRAHVGLGLGSWESTWRSRTREQGIFPRSMFKMRGSSRLVKWSIYQLRSFIKKFRQFGSFFILV